MPTIVYDGQNNGVNESDNKKKNITFVVLHIYMCFRRGNNSKHACCSLSVFTFKLKASRGCCTNIHHICIYTYTCIRISIHASTTIKPLDPNSSVIVANSSPTECTFGKMLSVITKCYRRSTFCMQR